MGKTIKDTKKWDTSDIVISRGKTRKTKTKYNRSYEKDWRNFVDEDVDNMEEIANAGTSE